MNPFGLAMLTGFLLLLWCDGAHAHGLPFFLYPIVASWLLFPLAMVCSLFGWLLKGLFYSHQTGPRSLSVVRWTDALKEAALVYVAFILAAFLDVGYQSLAGWSRWWSNWAISVVLIFTVLLSLLSTRFLQVRFLKRVDEGGRESFQVSGPGRAVLLGLIAPATFSLIVYLLVGHEQL